jgi:hypothetical protein
MSHRNCKALIFFLAFLLMVVSWKYFRLYGNVVEAGFVAHQSYRLRISIKDANDGSEGPDRVLSDLDWYLGYYDRRTNDFKGTMVFNLLKVDREYTLSQTMTYLRKKSTNDLGNDPYKWGDNVSPR